MAEILVLTSSSLSSYRVMLLAGIKETEMHFSTFCSGVSFL